MTEAKDADKKQDKVTLLLMFIGTRRGEKQSKVLEFVELPEDWQDAKKLDPKWKRRVYGKNVTGGAIGMVYSIFADAEKTSSVYPKSGSYKGMFPVKEVVAQLRLEEDNAQQVFALESAEKKDKRRKQYIELLEPIRRAYWNANPMERMLIMARVTKAITSTKPLRSDKDEDDDD